ncbi:tumor necrosis factor ligand superfamily member 4 [Pitangus sulphuratus]|nr:tumor necrosis factor ligand superfamily member 4 [Pitangus sulphuratus]
MEVQPEAEPRNEEQMDCKRECAEDEWKSWKRGQPQSIEVPWTHIRYSGKSIKGVAINLTAERGSIQIRNGSIMIPCDGLYLVSLSLSSIYMEENLLKLTLENTQKSISSVLWIQTVQSSDNTVNLTTVFFLFRDDYVTLYTSSDARIGDLSLSLVLVARSHLEQEKNRSGQQPFAWPGEEAARDFLCCDPEKCSLTGVRKGIQGWCFPVWANADRAGCVSGVDRSAQGSKKDLA